MGQCAMAYLWRSEGSLWELVSPFLCELGGGGLKAQVVRLGVKSLYPLRRPTSPIFLKILVFFLPLSLSRFVFVFVS